MTRCYLVRHAETAWNRENRIQGHSDHPLNPLGEEQAKRVAGYFASRHLRGIFTSHLQRSRQTAEAIAAGNGHGISPVEDPDLAEISLGVWEGLTPEEIDSRFGGAYQQWRVRPSTVQIPDGEPLETFRARIRRAVERIIAQRGEGDCVIVSHGGAISAILADVLDADYDALLRRLRLDNAGVTAVEFGTGYTSILWVNAVSHLLTVPESAGWF